MSKVGYITSYHFLHEVHSLMGVHGSVCSPHNVISLSALLHRNRHEQIDNTETTINIRQYIASISDRNRPIPFLSTLINSVHSKLHALPHHSLYWFSTTVSSVIRIVSPAG